LRREFFHGLFSNRKAAGKIAKRLDCVRFSGAFARKGTVKWRMAFMRSKSGAKAAAVQTLRAFRRRRRGAILKSQLDFYGFNKTIFIRANS